MNVIEQDVYKTQMSEAPIRMLKIKWRDDDYIATEWNSPSTVPIELIVHADVIQVFLGCRIMGSMTKSFFFKNLKKVEDMNTLKNGKLNIGIKLNGRQILKITELFRSFGHDNN